MCHKQTGIANKCSWSGELKWLYKGLFLANSRIVIHFTLRKITWVWAQQNISTFACMNAWWIKWPEMLRMYWHSPLIILNPPFDWAESFLRFNSIAEPSTFTRRALVIATPSARRFDNEPSATSWIQRSGSVNPQIRFRKSSKAIQSIHKSDASKAFSYPSVPMSLCPQSQSPSIPLSLCPPLSLFVTNRNNCGE